LHAAGRCGAAVGEVDDFALTEPINGSVRLLDETPEAFRQPMIYQLADRLRRLARDIPQQGDGHLRREGHVELAGDKGEDRSRAVWDHGIFDAVEVRPIPLPVIRIARHLDVFVRLELDEFETGRCRSDVGSPWRRDRTRRPGPAPPPARDALWRSLRRKPHRSYGSPRRDPHASL